MRYIGVALLIAACGAPGDGERWTGSVETLPNGAVRVTNPRDGVWEAGAPWHLVPEIAIGVVEGPEPEVFGAISGLEVDDAGRIYVLDRQANELRIFAPDGSHIRSVGRSGSGPGEYANANGLRWIAPDTLVVIDQRGNRYSILTRDGDYVRSVPRGLGFYGWVFTGGYDDGGIYENFIVGREEDARPALFGTSLRRAAREQRAGAAEEADGGVSRDLEVDTLYLPVPPGPLFEAFSVRTEQAGMSIGVPFAPRPIYHLDGRGSVWHGHGAEPRITRSSLPGDTIMEIVLNVDPTPVSQDEIDEWLAQPSMDRFRELGGRVDVNRIPRMKPFFDDLYVDPDRYLWLSMPAGPEEVAFGVVDPEGRYLGRLQVSGLRRDTFVPPVVRNGRLYVVGRDDLDVQRVYVFVVRSS